MANNRPARLSIAALAVASALVIGGVSPARAQTVPADVKIEQVNGFVRILLHLNEEVEADVNVAGGIVVVAFGRPVDIDLEKLQAELPNIVGAARRDPDGRGFRFSLTHKATVNSMAAGERLFIDLLPESWKGLPPGLPKDVVEDLSRRARDAERSLRNQRQAATKKDIKGRVRVAKQPTFTRYVFELPDYVAVTSERGADDVRLDFAAKVKFDFGEIKTALPATVKAIESAEKPDKVSVRFALAGKADLRMFREDKNYVVDIGAADGSDAAVTPPATQPATPASAATAPSDDAARFETKAGSGPLTMPARTSPQAVPTQPTRLSTPPSTPARDPQPAPRVEGQLAPASSPSQQNITSDDKAVPKSASVLAPHGSANTQERVKLDARNINNGLRLTFPFAEMTPAAIFRRAGALWMVFDTPREVDLSSLVQDNGSPIRYAQGTAVPDGYLVRFLLDRPRLVGAVADGNQWIVTIGDNVADHSIPLIASRNVASNARPTIIVPMDNAQSLHRIADPDTGDSLLVVTAKGPARGFIKPQDFVEFRALASTHGVAVQPWADDVQVEISADRIVVGRPSGLTLSAGGNVVRGGALRRRPILDPEVWNAEQEGKFAERQQQLIAAAADASEANRTAARFDLARFYLARGMSAEAKGVLDVALSDDRPTKENPSGLILQAMTLLMMDRPDDALKSLNNPLLGDLYDAPLWRAVAKARLGRWEEAHNDFRNVDAAIAALPADLQRMALLEVMQAAIETGDTAAAQTALSQFDVVGVPPPLRPVLAVLQGRLEQSLGKTDDALRYYQAAASSPDRKSAAQGQLRSLALRFETGALQRPEMIAELETLTALWRGDQTEVEALAKLAHLYTQEQRFRDAFYVMRSALKAHPNSDMTRRIQDEAMHTFDSLFLAGRADALPAVEALSLFYDFRDLTPIGRRGDEMIRRLADRLVSVDLLPQAADLLQHQIDHRLQGVARAQVASRLAVIYLLDRKPDRAQAILRATRAAELPTDVRQVRQLLEARALSDGGRHDVALEVTGNINNRAATRLRADILWAAKKYGEAAEQLELLQGERWRDFAPLSDIDRADILRAAIGYTLGGDTIGSRRLREKFEAKINDSPERRAFEVATAPYEANGEEFRALAKTVTAVNSLDAFLRELRARYPDIGATPPTAGPDHSSGADPMPTASISR